MFNEQGPIYDGEHMPSVVTVLFQGHKVSLAHNISSWAQKLTHNELNIIDLACMMPVLYVISQYVALNNSPSCPISDCSDDC